MSKYSDLNKFLNGLDDVSTADLNAKIALMVNADSSRVEMACDRLKGHTEDSLKSKLMCMLYADHVTAQQQAEITRLNARVAELEKELDGLSNSYATCGKPDCAPTQVCELFFNGCRS